MMIDKPPINRKDYKHFYEITTRWMDNDVYGHVNNVTYYSYFDTVINQYLIELTIFLPTPRTMGADSEEKIFLFSLNSLRPLFSHE